MNVPMTRRTLIALAGAGSLAMFLAALYYQYVVGLLPCVMCMWQRWPHRVAIGLAVIGISLPHAAVAWAGALSALIGAGLGVLHTGVEQGWWDGPQVCGASVAQDLGSLTVEELFDTTSGPQLVLCNEAAWHFAGLSMASWNALLCLVLAGLWIAAARKRA